MSAIGWHDTAYLMTVVNVTLDWCTQAYKHVKAAQTCKTFRASAVSAAELANCTSSLHLHNASCAGQFPACPNALPRSSLESIAARNLSNDIHDKLGSHRSAGFSGTSGKDMTGCCTGWCGFTAKAVASTSDACEGSPDVSLSEPGLASGSELF